MILSCGNYLNGGNAQRGQAEGFGIDILPKLKDLKTMSNTDNLMAFVVRFCIKKYDEDRGTPLAKLPVPEVTLRNVAMSTLRWRGEFVLH